MSVAELLFRATYAERVVSRFRAPARQLRKLAQETATVRSGIQGSATPFAVTLRAQLGDLSLLLLDLSVSIEAWDRASAATARAGSLAERVREFLQTVKATRTSYETAGSRAPWNVVESLDDLVDECRSILRERPERPNGVEPSPRPTNEYVDQLADDMRRERRASLVMYVLAAVSTALALAILVFLFFDAYLRPSDLNRGPLYIPLLGCGFLMVAAGTLALAAGRRWRAGDEMSRLRQHVAYLEPYLAPFPERASMLLRAALAPRLFSRTLNDDDPLREPLWPSAPDVIEAARKADNASGGAGLHSS